VFIRTFIYSKINTFALPKLSKISFAFNIFLPYACARNILFKGYPKNHPNGDFCVRKQQSENVSEKILGGLQTP